MMDRIIKYRAWDMGHKYNKEIPSCFHRSYTPKMVKVNAVYSENAIGFWDNMCYKKVTKNHYNFELMGFIGLKDKNNQEIYEGDIVMGDVPYYSEKVKGVVKSQCMGFAFVGKTESGKKWFDMSTNPDITKADVEVIGNRFENPEYLED